MSKSLLVLGVGNILLMDDGAGVHALRILELEKWPPNITFMDAGTSTQDIFFIFQEYNRVLILDCVQGFQPPGSLYRLTEKDLLSNEEQKLSLHDIGIIDSLLMAELYGKRPEEVIILGIEPACIGWGMKMTPIVTLAMKDFLKAARKEIAFLAQ